MIFRDESQLIPKKKLFGRTVHNRTAFGEVNGKISMRSKGVQNIIFRINSTVSNGSVTVKFGFWKLTVDIACERVNLIISESIHR